MQCSVKVETDRNCGNDKMKTIINCVNPYKERNFDNLELCSRLHDIQGLESPSHAGMPTISIEEEAIRRYYAAFPALHKGRESSLPYYLPPPAWCRKSAQDKVKMQSELAVGKDWNKNKKFSTCKERRNSYHGLKKNNKKRCNSYSRSFESKENLPEWVTHEGVWDMETQDPVKEFIRAIAFDEGYGTCENTVTEEIREANLAQVKFALKENMVPDWDDSLDLDAGWVITEDLNPRVRTPMEEELYAKFEAKFDRSIEALWSKEQSTPDDEYQDLPIDFQDLLSSPSDRLFADPSAEKRSLISLTESIWSTDAADFQPPLEHESPSRMAEALHDRFRPLNLADPEPEPRELASFALYEGDEIYDALASVASTMRSFTAINHSRDGSGFAEVPPRRGRERERIDPPPLPPRAQLSDDREDLLTSARTHFRPIRRETDREPARYADGDTFDIRGDPDPVESRRSNSGGIYIGTSLYLEYRADRAVDYSRPESTPSRGWDDEPGLRLRFVLQQRDAAVQTECEAEPAPAAAWATCEECGRAAKKMRPSASGSIWSERACEACAPVERTVATAAPAPPPDELSREWEELLSDISAAHAQYAGAGAECAGDAGGAGRAGGKRRHSAALRCAAQCTHPHARFLQCCNMAADRPLTR